VLIDLIDPAPHNYTNFVLDELWLIPITEPSTVRRFGQTYFFHLLNYQMFFHPRTYPAHLAIPFTHTTQYPPTPLTPNYTIHFQKLFYFFSWHGRPCSHKDKALFKIFFVFCRLIVIFNKKIVIVMFEEDDNEPIVIFWLFFPLM